MLRQQISRPNERASWLRARKQVAVKTAFFLLLGVLAVSMGEAVRVQRASSAETMEIYHRHVQQDDGVQGLRRALWYGGTGARDFLLDQSEDRIARYQKNVARHQKDAIAYLDTLDRVAGPQLQTDELRRRVNDFWALLHTIPEVTAKLSPAERYDFVQREIAARRNSVGNMVREIADVSQRSLGEAEAEFGSARQASASRLMAVLGLSLVLAIVAVYVSLRYTESLEHEAEQQYRQVQEAKEELESLAKRLFELQEEERTRLSRELHDEIGQALATLRLEILRVEPACREALPAVSERLARARDLAERTIQSVRDTSALLRPSLLDDLGLEAGLEWLIEDFSRRTGIPCKLSVTGVTGPLPQDITSCVFRVVQESLHNCEKHARATSASVMLHASAAQLDATIKDNGSGFSSGAKTRRPGLGLLGMRERAAVLGGALDIQSAPGMGTAVGLRIPLGNATPSDSPVMEAKLNANSYSVGR